MSSWYADLTWPTLHCNVSLETVFIPVTKSLYYGVFSMYFSTFMPFCFRFRSCCCFTLETCVVIMIAICFLFLAFVLFDPFARTVSFLAERRKSKRLQKWTRRSKIKSTTRLTTCMFFLSSCTTITLFRDASFEIFSRKWIYRDKFTDTTSNFMLSC